MCFHIQLLMRIRLRVGIADFPYPRDYYELGGLNPLNSNAEDVKQCLFIKLSSLFLHKNTLMIRLRTEQLRLKNVPRNWIFERHSFVLGHACLSVEPSYLTFFVAISQQTRFSRVAIHDSLPRFYLSSTGTIH